MCFMVRFQNISYCDETVSTLAPRYIQRNLKEEESKLILTEIIT